MAYRRSIARGNERGFLTRVGLLIVGSTAALTLAFLGVVAFLAGGVPDVAERVPFYVLGMAVVFVASVVGFEGRKSVRDGRAVLVAAGTLAAVAFALFALSGEGLMYAARNPDQALAAERLLYILAAGLMGTGVGYWGLHHREDVVRALR